MRNWGRVLSLLSGVLLILTVAADSAVAGLTLNGVWQYQNGDSEGQEAFTQRYGVDFSHLVSLTEAINASADIRYNRNDQIDEVHELFAPTLDLSVLNDIFTLRLGGAATERINSKSDDLSNRSVQGVWNSVWQRRFWPTLQVNYNRTWTEDDRFVHQIDSESWQGGIRADWDLEQARFYYRFNNTESDDQANLSESTNRRHFARLEAARQLFNNRASVAFSQQYSLNQNKTTQTGTGTSRLIKFTPDPPSRAGGVGLDPSTSLSWSDLSSPLPTPVPLDSYHVGVDLRNLPTQQVDAIYLYTSRQLTPAESQRFNWTLYSNGSLTGLFPWTPEAAPTVTYNNLFDRFEIVFPATITNKRFLLLQEINYPDDLNNTTAPLCLINGVEVYQRIEGDTFERDTTNWQTDVNISYRLSEKMNFSYGLLYETTDVSPGADFSRRNQTGNVTWLPNRYMSWSFDVSEILEERDQTPDQMNRKYGLTLSSPLLPTLDVGLGLARGESYTGGEKTTTRHDFSLTASAALYQDLDASLDLTYDTVDNEDSGTSSDNFRTRMQFTARMNPTLTVTLDEEYTKTGGASDVDSYDTELTANWRPSDLLAIRTDGEWFVRSEEEEWQGRVNVFLSFTRKTQINFGYRIRYVEAEPTAHDFILNFAWNINRYFSFNADGQYQTKGGDESWSVSSRLSASFTGR
jgi:hypothetical protein